MLFGVDSRSSRDLQEQERQVWFFISSEIVATAAALVYNLVKRYERNTPDIPKKDKHVVNDTSRYWQYKTPGPILVCTPSNVAADEICARIHRTGVKVVRLMALSKENLPSPIEELCVHIQARNAMEKESKHYSEIRASHDVRNGDLIDV